MDGNDLDRARTARAAATRAAARSGVRVRALASLAETLACERLLAEVWRTGADHPPLAADVIQALADAENYVAGAFEAVAPGDRLLGACVGFWGPPGRPRMHSHIAGVHDAVRGRDVGFALKLDQRAAGLEHGITEITWTFDPLVARNAHFNLRKLGGSADTYLVDHYGQMVDGLNGTDPTDRLVLRWDLAGERTHRACDEALPPEPGAPDIGAPERRLPRSGSFEPGAPERRLPRSGSPVPPPALLAADGDRPRHRPVDAERVLVAVPRDIETLRRRNPTAAREWRLAVREVLVPLLAGGARLVDFDRAASGYVVALGEPR
ncbi:GNAT family N-acetyltransferase [Micromonospora sp. NPDC049559]|uniref:GNAT family N-acetyltransferase n=1 Tax=Micromonospora sp. NPDC049559 TaxID=3155923 RepID=UPI00341C877A